MNGEKATRSPRSRGRTPSPLSKKANPRSAAARHADELMDLAVEAAQSRHLPGFLEQFALRATRMLDASWGAVVVYKGLDTEFHEMPGRRSPTSPLTPELLLSSGRGIGIELETRSLRQ